MYVYQDDKLYVQCGVNKLIGVEIYPDNVILVNGTETTLGTNYELLTPFEVQCRFGILNGDSYKFPKKEVDNNEPVRKTKTTSRKSTRK